jgi:hypothetical protein
VAKAFCACHVGILDIFSQITSAAGWQGFSSAISNRISAPFPKLPHNSGVNKFVLVYLTATSFGNLNLDRGYLSRILAGFAKKRLITREASLKDARESFVSLASRGKKEFSAIDEKAAAQAIALLKPLAAADRQKIVRAMSTIESVLSVEQTKSASTPPFILRPHRPGDMGWVVERHGALYAQEYGWEQRFEALVARIVADFVDHFDARHQRCWIAERNDQAVGCVFLVKHPDSPETVAKLRLLLVEPSARGFGIGSDWCGNARSLRVPPVTGKSNYGPTACSMRHATCTGKRGTS